MGAHFSFMPHHRRVAIETEIEFHLQRVELLLTRLDRADGAPDLETTGIEDDFMQHRGGLGPGCPVSDPGGCEIADGF